MTTTWYEGTAPLPLPKEGTPAEADSARRYCATLVRRAADAGTLPPCPQPPLHEVGPNRRSPVAMRGAMSLEAQWVAYLMDYLGLWWPDTESNRTMYTAVRDCGPVSKPLQRPRE